MIEFFGLFCLMLAFGLIGDVLALWLTFGVASVFVAILGFNVWLIKSKNNVSEWVKTLVFCLNFGIEFLIFTILQKIKERRDQK